MDTKRSSVIHCSIIIIIFLSLMDQDRVINLDQTEMRKWGFVKSNTFVCRFGGPIMNPSFGLHPCHRRSDNVRKLLAKDGEETTVVIPAWQFMSYFSDPTGLWFLEPEFANQIVRLHNVVGNAVTENRHIVVGTDRRNSSCALRTISRHRCRAHQCGFSSSLLLFEISCIDLQSYPLITDCVKSGLYKWGGDARSFNKTGPYIELVTSPNNPDGFARRSVVNANYDLMLFTISKHGSCRDANRTSSRGALVKDEDVARKMTKYIEINTIGVSKDSQLRAAKVLKVISDNSERPNSGDSFFEFSYHVMAKRWKQLREAVHESGLFSVPDFPQLCKFPRWSSSHNPCEGEIEDCESFLRRKKILTRSGKHFGVSPNFCIAKTHRVEKLKRSVQVQRARKDEYGSIISRISRVEEIFTDGQRGVLWCGRILKNSISYIVVPFLSKLLLILSFLLVLCMALPKALAEIEDEVKHSIEENGEIREAISWYNRVLGLIEGGHGKVRFTFNDMDIENSKQEYSFTIDMQMMPTPVTPIHKFSSRLFCSLYVWSSLSVSTDRSGSSTRKMNITCHFKKQEMKLNDGCYGASDVPLFFAILT
ncbi:putative Apoptosis-stimulating of p53 protein 1 [Hibiscus syriacus]|uniref:Apoptosis-stimulating of p53 protein 1 n=1 Tax=Hibiscus syriacus TaxID=106335 RepID=A0A6A3A1F6_HIBSY|nr:putative Apoptosis-stimulating of p53 protein 1 [Hibiscus syriacus]